MLERMTSLLRPISRLLDLALPAACAGCGVEGEPLCAMCRPALDARLTLPAGTPLGLAEGPPEPLLQLDWCAPFAGATRRSLHALKYSGERRLAVPLGAAVAARWRAAGAGGDLFVPVPVHPSRRRERGYDQAELIAAAASDVLGLPWRPALARTRATAAQYRLDRRHRASNVHAAFEVRAGPACGVAGRWVVLVDDVVTTGATLVACAEALLASGATAVSAVTVARER
jgi:ComF family protein